jgi:serine 3-dehydrogenase (NADP+)
MPTNLKDQVVLIIGASSGIGRATAVLFAQQGAKVIAAARRQDRLEALQSELAAQGLPIEIQSADASLVADMDNLAHSTLAAHGHIDIMIFATGTNTPDRSLLRLNPEIWNHMVTTNLNGAYYATQAVLPSMRERKSGQLIYISSISGQTPDVSGAAYQAGKRGLIGLAHAIRVEEKDNGIRTCAICPGLVETEILEKRPVKPSAEMLAKALQPEDVAEATLSVALLHPRAAITELTIVPTAI